MRGLELSRHRGARIWLNELPEACFLCDKVFERTYESSFVNETERTGAIELMIPRGARTQYGLLGGRFSGRHGSQLSVRVLSSEKGPAFQSASAAEHTRQYDAEVLWRQWHTGWRSVSRVRYPETLTVAG
jgi:hypothetical protein